MEGLGDGGIESKKENREKELTNKDNSVVIMEGWGVGGGRRGYRGNKW